MIRYPAGDKSPAGLFPRIYHGGPASAAAGAMARMRLPECHDRSRERVALAGCLILRRRVRRQADLSGQSNRNIEIAGPHNETAGIFMPAVHPRILLASEEISWPRQTPWFT